MVDKVTIPDWETIFFALCDSAMTDGAVVRIDEHFSVIHNWWAEASLFYNDRFRDEFDSKLFDTSDIAIICCEDEEEYAGECASTILERFESWYGRQEHPAETIADVTCWEQAEPFVVELDKRETAVYENCCDYLYYGESFVSLMEREHNYGLDEGRVKELWKLAFWFMSEGCMCDDPYVTAWTARYAA